MSAKSLLARAYEGRRDLGNTEPGDGVRFRGRGLIQITGRTNYRACSLGLYGDERLLQQPEILEGTVDACRSAGWFWQTMNLNKLADIGAFRPITRAINGGSMATRIGWRITNGPRRC